MIRGRRIVASSGVAAALVAGALVPHSDAATGGFQPVKTFEGEITGLVASGPDEAWVSEAVRGANFTYTYTVHHYKAGVWTTVPGGPRINKVISASAPDDVWAWGVASPQTVPSYFHYDGTAWTQVQGPQQRRATGVVRDVPGPDAYLVYDEPGTGSDEVFRYDGTTFVSEGIPYQQEEGQEGPSTEYGRVTDVRSVDGTLVVKLDRHRGSDYPFWSEILAHRNSTWTSLMQADYAGRGTATNVRAWSPRSVERHLLLGDQYPPSGVLCSLRTKTESITCDSGGAVTSGVELPGDRVLVAGGTFRVLDGSGNALGIIEGTASGESMMSATPDGHQAWVATQHQVSFAQSLDELRLLPTPTPSGSTPPAPTGTITPTTAPSPPSTTTPPPAATEQPEPVTTRTVTSVPLPTKTPAPGNPTDPTKTP